MSGTPGLQRAAAVLGGASGGHSPRVPPLRRTETPPPTPWLTFLHPQCVSEIPTMA